MANAKYNLPPHQPPPPGSHNEFKQMVREAIADELGAVAMYSNMANMVNNPTLKALILTIVADEYGHARTWMTILELDP